MENQGLRLVYILYSLHPCETRVGGGRDCGRGKELKDSWGSGREKIQSCKHLCLWSGGKPDRYLSNHCFNLAFVMGTPWRAYSVRGRCCPYFAAELGVNVGLQHLDTR